MPISMLVLAVEIQKPLSPKVAANYSYHVYTVGMLVLTVEI